VKNTSGKWLIEFFKLQKHDWTKGYTANCNIYVQFLLNTYRKIMIYTLIIVLGIILYNLCYLQLSHSENTVGIYVIATYLFFLLIFNFFFLNRFHIPTRSSKLRKYIYVIKFTFYIETLNITFFCNFLI